MLRSGDIVEVRDGNGDAWITAELIERDSK